MSGNSKQKLIIITGSPCVGKTTVAESLFEEYKTALILTVIGHGAFIRFHLTTRGLETAIKSCLLRYPHI